MTVLDSVIPILRIYDEQKARKFYVRFLGFEIVFEHRYEAGFPLYMGVSLSGCMLHLSEHNGDASPGAQVRIQAKDVDSLAAELAAKDYKQARQGQDDAVGNQGFDNCRSIWKSADIFY